MRWRGGGGERPASSSTRQGRVVGSEACLIIATDQVAEEDGTGVRLYHRGGGLWTVAPVRDTVRDYGGLRRWLSGSPALKMSNFPAFRSKETRAADCPHWMGREVELLVPFPLSSKAACAGLCTMLPQKPVASCFGSKGEVRVGFELSFHALEIAHGRRCLTIATDQVAEEGGAGTLLRR